MGKTIKAADIGELIHKAPIPPRWKREVLPLFLTAHDMKRILAWEHLYRQVLDVHGEVFQFGVGYGRDLNILACLRRWLEPNTPRRFIGFDSFDGIAAEDIRGDVDGPKAEPGYYGFPEAEEFLGFLRAWLERHCPSHPSSDKSPFELVVGKAQDTLPQYLEDYQGAVALAFFDMLVYQPTVECLELVRERMPSGSIIGFNQWHTPGWTGEAAAFREVFGFKGRKICRVPSHRYWGYVKID